MESTVVKSQHRVEVTSSPRAPASFDGMPHGALGGVQLLGNVEGVVTALTKRRWRGREHHEQGKGNDSHLHSSWPVG
jgi:hypothetical protein